MSASIRIGIPAHCEQQSLPQTLEALAAQDDRDFEVVACINQAASWFHDPAHQAETSENLATLDGLEKAVGHYPFPLRVLDAVDPATAPSSDEAGVGWARRRIFDDLDATQTRLCISLDADTLVPTDYVAQVRRAFARYPKALALVVPYWHPLPEQGEHALRLLRYELYMRYYQISLWRAGSPYAFTALGSALAFRSDAYQRAGGFPPRPAGEDFYLVQQFCKLGPVMRFLDCHVTPSARASRRVPFGTGPLMAESSLELQEARFPFFDQTGFDLLAQSIALFPSLYQKEMQLPIAPWLPRAVREPAAYAGLRRVLPSEAHFVRACHERIDGLRTLQYLRNYQQAQGRNDAGAQLNLLLQRLGEPAREIHIAIEHLSALEDLRQVLRVHEAANQQAYMATWGPRQ